MSVETEGAAHEGEGYERREETGKRHPFDSLVEVGGALGPGFEAQALDVSKGGMHLRTAYLPEVGQPLTCRFDAGGREVLASGAVVWRHEEGRGGEFAIRFDQMDPKSVEALGRVVDDAPACAPRDPGARVRLHIEGLGSPMRARVKGSGASELTVGSELGFLQVGKQLELEDAATGGKRPARIDRVEVEIDPESKVPQLVVTLRYDDAPEANAPATVKSDGTPEPSVIDDPEADADALAGMANMKSAFSRAAAQVGPVAGKLAKRAWLTLALLAARARSAEASVAPRRTTAPPPGGGLHASGRRVVRGDAEAEAHGKKPGRLAGKRGYAIGGAVACAAAITLFAVHKTPASSPPTSVAESAPPPGSAPPTMPAAAPFQEPILAAQPPAVAPVDTDPGPAAEDTGHKKPGHVVPFGSGPVAHGNQLHIKMDGAIDKIEGASTPTGFTVVVPNRRSLEAAAPLAARDGRIASIRVTNEAHGAELAVTFKDGVPNYQVRAKGDTLEIVLATAGKVLENDTPRTIPKVATKKRVKH